jgi:hypothetical protein
MGSIIRAGVYFPLNKCQQSANRDLPPQQQQQQNEIAHRSTSILVHETGEMLPPIRIQSVRKRQQLEL